MLFHLVWLPFSSFSLFFIFFDFLKVCCHCLIDQLHVCWTKGAVPAGSSFQGRALPPRVDPLVHRHRVPVAAAVASSLGLLPLPLPAGPLIVARSVSCSCQHSKPSSSRPRLEGHSSPTSPDFLPPVLGYLEPYSEPFTEDDINTASQHIWEKMQQKPVPENF